jgi:hypothetical protein
MHRCTRATKEIMRPFFVAITTAAALAFGALGGCATTHLPTRTGSAVATAQSPTERYEFFRAALDKAEALEELLPLTSSAVRDEMTRRPPAYRKAILADLKTRGLGQFRVVAERIDGDVAWLTVEGTNLVDPEHNVRSHARGSVVLLRQDGAWRVDDEVWTLEGDSQGELGPQGWSKASVAATTNKR